MDCLHGQNSYVSSTTQQPKEDTSKEKRCAVCQKNAANACSACKSVDYCSVEHQKLDWKNHKKVCQPFSIEQTKDMGMGWVATRNLKAGLILLEELPVIQAPAWKWDSSFTDEAVQCATCAITMDCMGTCSTCFWPVCSDRCAKHPLHLENECKELVSRKLEYPPPPSWPMGMLIFCLRANALKARDPRKFKQMMTLQDFYAIPSKNQDLRTTDLPPGMFDVLSGPNCLSREEFRKLFRICKVNNCEGESPPVDSDLYNGSLDWNRCVYLNASRLNHSCFPNCAAVLVQPPLPKFQIRTAVPIVKGQELTINYYDSKGLGFQPTSMRQSHLKEKGIICKCKRCLDPTELETFLSGIKCFKCSRNVKTDSASANKCGFFVPANPVDADSPDAIYECHRCHAKLSFLRVKASLPKTVRLAFLNSEQWTSSCCVPMKALESLLSQYEEGRELKEHLHRNHWLIQSAMRKITKAVTDDDLELMSERKLGKLVSRLQFLLKIDDQLYPGLYYPARYEDVKLLHKAATVLEEDYGEEMNEKEYSILGQIIDKVEREQTEYLRVELSTASEEEKSAFLEAQKRKETCKNPFHLFF